jgi:hypothetical protein
MTGQVDGQEATARQALDFGFNIWNLEYGIFLETWNLEPGTIL